MPNNSTMTDAAVMNVLFMKFQDLCRSGKDAHLSFESKWVFTSTFPQDIYAQAGFKLILLPISQTNWVGVGLSWAELRMELLILMIQSQVLMDWAGLILATMNKHEIMNSKNNNNKLGLNWAKLSSSCDWATLGVHLIFTDYTLPISNSGYTCLGWVDLLYIVPLQATPCQLKITKQTAPSCLLAIYGQFQAASLLSRGWGW